MLNNLKSKLFKSIKSKKLNVFGFFLLLSFLFLVIAKLSKTYTETISFYVTYSNVPEQYSISANRDSVVDVKVNAFGFNLLSHNFFKHTITVDFEDEVKKHSKKYSWDTNKALSRINSQLGSSIEVLSIQPDSLNFPFEIMTVKTVPIQLDSEITYASGYDVHEKLKLEPDSVKVIGPKNSVEKINKITTELLKLKEVNAPIDQIINLIKSDAMDKIKLSQSKVQVVGVVEKFTEGTFEVPVDIINLPENLKINYFPKTVSVSYYVSLENYKNIKALDFKVICDFAEAKDMDKSFFTPHLIEKPEQVKSARMKQNKIEFIIVQ